VRFTAVVQRPSFAVWSVSCPGGRPAASVRADYRLVLVRRGRLRRCGVDLDRTVGYVGVPGEEERFAHPAGGDECTSVSLSADLGSRLVGAARPAAYVDARMELAHRRLLACAADADYAVVEALLALLCRSPVAGRAGDRSLVALAREALAAGDPAADGLLSLAESLGVSPYRLSRAFTRELGVSLTRYRNRLRVGVVLDRLARGEQHLARLAADLGFADQAHLCRTVRAHVGHTPTAVRRLLT
jgi:AraC-like DNA-binding protein